MRTNDSNKENSFKILFIALHDNLKRKKKEKEKTNIPKMEKDIFQLLPKTLDNEELFANYVRKNFFN